MDNTSTVHIIEICIIRFLPLRGFMQNGLKQQTKPRISSEAFHELFDLTNLKVTDAHTRRQHNVYILCT